MTEEFQLIRYSSETKREVLRLAKEGVPYRQIAARLGIKRVSTVADWVRVSDAASMKMSAGLVRKVTNDQMRAALERRDAYLRTLPPVLNPNITVLGDPMPGRSALDQKRAGQ